MEPKSYEEWKKETDNQKLFWERPDWTPEQWEEYIQEHLESERFMLSHWNPSTDVLGQYSKLLLRRYLEEAEKARKWDGEIQQKSDPDKGTAEKKTIIVTSDGTRYRLKSAKKQELDRKAEQLEQFKQHIREAEADLQTNPDEARAAKLAQDKQILSQAEEELEAERKALQE